jgi:hypothetical protein
MEMHGRLNVHIHPKSQVILMSTFVMEVDGSVSTVKLAITSCTMV